MTDATTCPLCSAKQNRELKTTGQRQYYFCKFCHLIFLDRQYLPEPAEEVNRYREHRNSPDDPGYVNFLNKAILPALPYLKPGMQGLDYGCGPAPVLAQQLSQKHQIACEYYDPFFFPDLPDRQYDFIFSTEAFEHFFEPAREIEKLHQRLRPGAYLCLMTQCWESLEDFDQWWYRRDLTHVSFYHRETIRYISENWRMKLIYHAAQRVFILQKS